MTDAANQGNIGCRRRRKSGAIGISDIHPLSTAAQYNDTCVIMIYSGDNQPLHIPAMRSPASPTRLKAPSIVSASCILGLLYAGRAILQPIALALILSLIIAPLIRTLGQHGMRRVPATLAALLLAGACAAGIGAILTVQLISVTAELPEYQAALRQKAGQLGAQAERPFAWMEANLHAAEPLAAGAESDQPLTAAASRQPIP